MLRVLIGVLLLAVTTSAIPVQAIAALPQVEVKANVSSSGERISVAFDSTPLRDAIWTIAKRSGVRILFAEKSLPSKQVNYHAIGITPTVALSAILYGTGLRVAKAADGGLELVKSISKERSAQGVISGKVTNAKTGRAIFGATVSIDNDRGTPTNEDGLYRLTPVSVGTHTVTVRLIGYTKQTRSVVVGEGVSVTADFKLEPGANVLDQVIVTGTVAQTELKAVPNAITVITAKQIEERGITRIDQLFRGDIPGLFSLNMGSGSTLDEVVMFSRGATALFFSSPGIQFGITNPIKTYIDGVELADPKYLSQIDPRSIERIEILTGPQASTIYGSNAINGVMQIFTKRGTTNRPQINIGLQSGAAQNNFSSALAPSYNADTRISGLEGRLAYNVGGSLDYIGSWTPSKNTVRYDISGGSRIAIGKFTTDVNARRDITQNKTRGASATYTVSLREQGFLLPNATSGLAKPSVGTLNGTTAGVVIGYTPVNWWSQELTLGIDANQIGNVGSVPGFTSSGDTLISYAQTSSARASERYSTVVQLPFTNAVQATVTLGADHWRSQGSEVRANSLLLTGTLGQPEVTRNKPGKNRGGFAQGQIAIHDALFLTYGFRAEWNPGFGENVQPNVVPRYGVAYTSEISAVTAKLRASYGRSTRPPAEALRLSRPARPASGYDSFDDQLANLDLTPEFQQGGEGGLEIYFGNRGSLVVTRYNQTVDGLISHALVDSVRSVVPNPPSGGSSFDPEGYGYVYQEQYLNLGSIRNQGWELQSSMITGPISTRGTYTLAKSRIIGITPKYRQFFAANLDLQPGSSFLMMPEHTWALTFTYAQAQTNFSLTANGTGQGMPQTAANGFNFFTTTWRDVDSRLRMQYPAGYRETTSGYTILHVNATHKFTPKVEGVLQIQNLTNFYTNDQSITSAVMGRQSKLGARIRL